MDNYITERASNTAPGTFNFFHASFLRPLFPNEPRILNLQREQALTDLHLMPVLAELEVFLLAVRARIDAIMQPACPVKFGKPYPLGQCLEITLAAERALRRLDISGFDKTALGGLAAFKAFIKGGGTFRHVWGDLRGEFFQNAFQLGSLYVDVSNDTVVPTKPKVEILPFAQARFTPIKDFRHFAQIASRYWKDRVVPNHVLPEIAPYCPLIHVSPSGTVLIRDTTAYMMALTQADGFHSSEDVLGDAAMPDDLFRMASQALEGFKFKPARTPAEGRELALQHCRRYRAKRWHILAKRADRIVAATLEANRRLATASSKPDIDLPRTSMLFGAPQNRHRESSLTYVPVSAARHSGKRWRRHTDFLFAAKESIAPLGIQELPPAMSSLPIGFIAADDQYLPVAILGIVDGKNAFVAPDGQWCGDYIPAVYRCHPFTCVEPTSGQLVMCVEQNNVLSAAEGEPFFTGDGIAAQGMREMAQMLKEMKQHEKTTRDVCAILRKYKLLQPWHIKIRIGTREHDSEGIFRIDETVLHSLPTSASEEMRQSGALEAAHCQLASMRHLVKLQGERY